MKTSRGPQATLGRWNRRGKPRDPLPASLRRELRARAGDKCEACGRPLAGVAREEIPPDVARRALVLVHDDYPCWKCHRPTTILRVVDGDKVLELKPGDERSPFMTDLGLELIGPALTEIYPTVYRDYSRTTRSSYWANHCQHCGALQGAWFVGEWGLSNHKPSKTFIIPVSVELYPGGIREEIREWGHVHHRDGNPANNDPGNLELLCVRCHAARHAPGVGRAST